MPGEEYLTTEEASKLLKISRGTVCKLAREGQLPALRVGKQWRIPHESPEMWLYRQKQSSRRTASGLGGAKSKRSGFDDLLKLAAQIGIKTP